MGAVTLGVPRETYPGERRVALTPAAAGDLSAGGFEVLLEAGAGEAAGYPDPAYAERGGRIAPSRDEAFAADAVLQVRTIGANPDAGAPDLERLRPGQVVVGMADPLGNPEAVRAVAERGATLFALELLPRIARAQSMDVLSSQATVAGYRAAVLAAANLPKLFPMLTTAAGTLPAARVLVLGAGVAGLQAIATARRLGALVEAYDVRPAAREEVESLGARFVELPLSPGDAEDAGGYAKELSDSFYLRQQEHLASVVTATDAVICTAMIPGKPAPVLLTEEAVAGMALGSVVVDAAAERGGNCAVTRPGETLTVSGVRILGPVNLPADLPREASQMYARNLTAFLRVLAPEGAFDVASEDEIIRHTLAATGGAVVNHQIPGPEGRAA
ncbi:MAG TPA: NAD(P) transhydrogenase subunit alpha [Actinomycetota bacterium]|nr:NAD(P) transhydrogenase subunit alpha [Actinomycetota bacterium]